MTDDSEADATRLLAWASDHPGASAWHAQCALGWSRDRLMQAALTAFASVERGDDTADGAY